MLGIMLPQNINMTAVVQDLPQSATPATTLQRPWNITVQHNDARDMHARGWQPPPPPHHRGLACTARFINRVWMSGALKAGALVLAAVLKGAGYRRVNVATRAGRVNALVADGSGPLPPIALVVGIGGASTDYIKMLLKLKSQHRQVIAVDLPGQAFSGPWVGPVDAATLCGAVQDAFDVLIEENAFIMGHSLGGLPAARYALARPERVLGVTLASPVGAPFTPLEYAHFRELYTMQTREHARVIVHNGFYGEPNKHPFIISAAWYRLARPLAQAMIASDMFSGGLAPEELRSLQVPTQLLWGPNDHLLPAWHYHYFVRHLPAGTRIVRPPGMNHNNTAEALPEVMGALLSFAYDVTAQGLVQPPPQLMPPGPSPWRHGVRSRQQRQVEFQLTAGAL